MTLGRRTPPVQPDGPPGPATGLDLGRLRRAMRPKPAAKRDEWLCGYAAALANIIRTCGETGLAKIAMDSDGLTLAHFKQAGVEKYDLDALKKAR